MLVVCFYFRLGASSPLPTSPLPVQIHFCPFEVQKHCVNASPARTYSSVGENARTLAQKLVRTRKM